MTVLYGIKNCDTVKKARQWLDNHQVDYSFHDFRSDGLDSAQVAQWIKVLGAEKLINKRSTTWKQLSDDEKQAALADGTVELILAHPTLVKRPLLETGDTLHCGFKEAEYAAFFA
jgi:arsenate reductase